MSDEQGERRCGTCRFEGFDGFSSVCQRYAPKQADEQNRRAIWPRVGAYESCGEWTQVEDGNLNEAVIEP